MEQLLCIALFSSIEFYEQSDRMATMLVHYKPAHVCMIVFSMVLRH